jgi:UPF0755 protein
MGDSPASDDATSVRFTVPQGASAAEIGQSLEQAGLVRSGAAFRLQAEVRRVSSRLNAGDYDLRPNMTVAEILDTLIAGEVRSGSLVTIPEGWRAEEIANLLDSRGIVDGSSFMEIVEGRRPIEGLALPEGAPSFEGYLFPETYDYGREPSAESVVRMMVKEFERNVMPKIRASATAQGLSLHEAVTLASIIEREAVQASERPRVSSVFHNRLRRGMPLEADPTAQYALVSFGTLRLAEPYWKAQLSPSDLAMQSPYNTYRVAGLPPGPICNPGLAAIEAATDPTDDPFLYFVALGDGSHLFGRTLDEHLRNIARAREHRPSM